MFIDSHNYLQRNELFISPWRNELKAGCRYRSVVRGEPKLDLKGRVAGSGPGRLGLCNTFGLVSDRCPMALEVATAPRHAATRLAYGHELQALTQPLLWTLPIDHSV